MVDFCRISPKERHQNLHETFRKNSLNSADGKKSFHFALKHLCHLQIKCKYVGQIWAAANGGVTNGGLRGVWQPFLEIGRNRPFSPFYCLFRPFPEGAKSTWEIQKTEEKGLFPQISSDLLKPPSLKPPFAALQQMRPGIRVRMSCRHQNSDV